MSNSKPCSNCGAHMTLCKTKSKGCGIWCCAECENYNLVQDIPLKKWLTLTYARQV